MNMIWLIVERFAEISTIVLNVFFLYRTMNTKVSIKKQIIAGVLLLIMRMTYYCLGFEHRPYFTLVISIIYTFIVFEGKFRTYALWTVLAVVIDGVVDASVVGIFLLIPNTSIALISTPGMGRTIIVIAAKVILFLAYYFASKKVDKNDTIAVIDSVFLISVPLSCWMLLEIIFKYSSELYGAESRLIMIFGGSAFLLIIISTVILYNRITASRKELVHSKLQLHMSQMTQEHIEQINNLYMQLSAIRHDLHNHFSAIAGYLSAKEYPALEEYISKLTDVDMEISEHNIKHPVLNALISSRLVMATKENIDFTTNIMMPEQLPISDVDLCILVSNMLDNAFDANRKAFEPHFINLTAQRHDAYWVIACRNAVRDKGNFRSSGNIKSTKESGIHGIGTRQIKEIAEKTGGFATYRHKDYEFSTLVMLKMTDE